MNKKLLIVLALCVILFMTTGCADPQVVTTCLVGQPAGFWWGLWHGLTIWFSFFGQLFGMDVAMWAVNNTGGWYYFGFWLGIGSISSGSGTVVKIKT